MEHQENINGWRVLLPILAIGLLILGDGLIEAVANLIGAVAGAR